MNKKPYINLDTSLPGIVSLFRFDMQVAKPMADLAEVLLRRPSSLSIGERELIAAFVSKINNAAFCYGSHAACARQFMDNYQVDAFLEDEDSEVLSMRLRGLMVVAANVQSMNQEEMASSILKAKAVGATDQEIHDTVAIAAAFSMYNRYVEGLGAIYQEGDLEQSGASLAKYGYRMSLTRLVKEVLPRWLKNTFHV